MSLPPIIRALRPAQWIKNSLILVAAISSHQLLDPAIRLPLAQLLVAMCLLASMVYVMNDLVDVAADRRHPQKRHRPFASGALAVAHAGWLLPLLLVVVLALAWRLAPAAQAVLGIYLGLNLLYSLWLKRLLWLDVLLLASLYTARVLAGAFAIGVAPSEWLLAFSMFVFVSLAALKRYIELIGSDGDQLPGRGYRRDDASTVLAFGAAAAAVAVLVMALYVNSEAVRELYRQPQWLWAICLLLWYWLARVWTLAHRGELQHDPVLFAVRDPLSWLVVLLMLGSVALAS